VHELVGREGYELDRPTRRVGPPAPAGPVASKVAADLNDLHYASGATANRQARYRYLRTVAARPDSFAFLKPEQL